MLSRRETRRKLESTLSFYDVSYAQESGEPAKSGLEGPASVILSEICNEALRQSSMLS